MILALAQDDSLALYRVHSLTKPVRPFTDGIQIAVNYVKASVILSTVAW